MQNTEKMERKHGQKRAPACCAQWGLVMKAAVQNQGLILAECGKPMWDMGTFEAAGVEDADGIDFAVRFCPFCGHNSEGTPRAQPVIPGDRPLTTAEAVAYLRMDHLKHGGKMLGRYVLEGRLHCLRRGRTVMFTKAQLDAFLTLQRGR